jgi:hypothetical protein
MADKPSGFRAEVAKVARVTSFTAMLEASVRANLSVLRSQLPRLPCLHCLLRVDVDLFAVTAL